MKFLADFFPILLFFIAYVVTKDIFLATKVIMVASVVQVSWSYIRHRKVERMHMATMVAVLLMGGLTLALHDSTFIKWKPTVMNWLFALVFLGSAFVGERNVLQRMMGHAITLPARIWTRLNFAWVLFFLFVGVANLYVAYNFEEETWVNFKMFGVLGMTLVFILAQGFYMARHTEPDSVEQAPEEEV